MDDPRARAVATDSAAPSIGGMTDTATPVPSNPYVTALLWVGGLGLVAAVVLAIGGNAALKEANGLFGSASALARAAAFGAAADIAGLVGIVSIVGALVILGVRWKPKAPVARGPEVTPGTIPPGGHWLDKKK